MTPGFYVVRLPARGNGSRLMIESRCFKPAPEENISIDWTRQQAGNWADWIKTQHPKDEVFVIERFPDEETN